MNSTPNPRDVFVTTRWTMVLSAGRKSSPHSERALAELCQTYWYPLYAFVRRQGKTKEDAEDLVQTFFARFLEKNYLEGLAADRGKFRAFLLAALKHFLANEWDRAQAQKRGGGAEHLSLNWQDADERFHLDPPDPTNPERLFDREWALAMLDRVITRLAAEMCPRRQGGAVHPGEGLPHGRLRGNSLRRSGPATRRGRRRPARDRPPPAQALPRTAA
jgi:RNA polymerase sigma-70 factor (ECF subfamily)